MSVDAASVIQQFVDVAMNGDRCAGSAGPATGWQCRVVDRSGRRFRGHRARGIIERAEKRGQLRLVEMNRRTADDLTKIIGGLEGESPADDSGDNDAC
jgi:hypothetical protein